MAYNLSFKPYGKHAVLVEWAQEINENILLDVISFKSKIEKSNIKQILEIKQSYCSLLVIYDFETKDLNAEISTIKKIYNDKIRLKKLNFRQWIIPVCYDDVFGIDLESLSLEKKMLKSEIIKLHSEAVYTTYFIGFLPGFLYLGGLDKQLHAPRKSTPRLQIEKGAVAIGGNQTGIYPMTSPGGWNIIGNTPVSLFDVHKNPPCFVSPGDKIKFKPVSISEYNDIKLLVEAGVYQVESEVLHG